MGKREGIESDNYAQCLWTVMGKTKKNGFQKPMEHKLVKQKVESPY